MLAIAIRLERREFALRPKQLFAQVQDHLDASEVHAEFISQPFNKTDLFDIAVAEQPNITLAALRRDQPAPLVHAEALLVQAAHIRCHFDRVVILHHRNVDR